MRVRDCMTEVVQVIHPDAPAWEAVAHMRRHQIRRLPVVDGDALVGIVTWTDLVRIQPPAIGGRWQIPNLTAGVLVRHLMTSMPITVGPEAPIEEAASMMRRHKIGGLPVVERGRLIGILTESDLFDMFVEMLATGPDEIRLHVPVGSVAIELPRIVAGLAKTAVPIVSLHTIKTRGVEAVDLVVHHRDVARARAALSRLTLEVDRGPEFARPPERG